MSYIRTIEDLIEEVRSQLDEDNTTGLDSVRNILPPMRRAYRKALDLLSVRYAPPVLHEVEVQMVAGQDAYPMPRDCYGQRVVKLEYSRNATGINGTCYYNEVDIISYRQSTILKGGNHTSGYPHWAYLQGGCIRLLDGNCSGTLRVTYVRNPGTPGLPQGVVTKVNKEKGYIVVDTAGSALTTERGKEGNWISAWRPETASRLGLWRVKALDDNRIIISTKEDQSFRGETALTALDGIQAPCRYLETSKTNPPGEEEVRVGDLIATGCESPLIFMPDLVPDFIVEMTVQYLANRSGRPDQGMIEDFKKSVETMWSGRESTAVVKRKRSGNQGYLRYMQSSRISNK